MTSSTNLIDQVCKANLAAYDDAGSKDYIDGAPHLKHDSLRRLYASLLVDVFSSAKIHNQVPRVLDLGAGEGSVTLPMLELGAEVTAVDLSSDMLAELKRKCSKFADRLTVREEGVEVALQNVEGQFEIITANSFLHHVPDYFGMLEGVIQRLSAHGQFFSFQDPLKYSTLRPGTRTFDRMAFFTWRVGKADAWNGLKRYLRRARGEFQADSAYDNAEYHVLRGGVDQAGMKALFEKHGFTCKVIPYFSTQSSLFQPIGAAIGFQNTFAFVASRA
jgi:SAM-dependent methyltransferase